MKRMQREKKKMNFVINQCIHKYGLWKQDKERITKVVIPIKTRYGNVP